MEKDSFSIASHFPHPSTTVGFVLQHKYKSNRSKKGQGGFRRSMKAHLFIEASDDVAHVLSQLEIEGEGVGELRQLGTRLCHGRLARCQVGSRLLKLLLVLAQLLLLLLQPVEHRNTE